MGRGPRRVVEQGGAGQGGGRRQEQSTQGQAGAEGLWCLVFPAEENGKFPWPRGKPVLLFTEKGRKSSQGRERSGFGLGHVRLGRPLRYPQGDSEEAARSQDRGLTWGLKSGVISTYKVPRP